MTSSDRGSDSDHGSASPLARGGQPPNGNHRRHLSSGGSSDDSSTDHDRDQPRNTSGLPVSFASNLNDAITGGGMVRVDSAKHIHEAMATIPGLHKRGKSLELPMTKRLAFRKCRSLTKRLPALLCMGLVVFLLCSAVFKPRGGNGAAEMDQLNFGGPDGSTKIPRADPGGERRRRRAMPLKLASSIGNELVHELDDLGRPMLRGAGHAVSSGLSAIGHIGGHKRHKPRDDDDDR